MDERAYEVVFRRWWLRLCQYLHRYVGKDMAEDVAQSTLFLAVRRWDDFPTVEKAQWSWLRQAAEYLMRKALDKEDSQRTPKALSSDAWAAPDRGYLHVEHQAVEKAWSLEVLGMLSSRDRQVFTLSYELGLSDREAGTVLAISESAYSTAKHRMREHVSQAQAQLSARTLNVVPGGVEPGRASEEGGEQRGDK